MATEITALIISIYYTYIIPDMVSGIIGRNIQIEAFVDSRTVFDVSSKDGRMTEFKLQIDICALR